MLNETNEAFILVALIFIIAIDMYVGLYIYIQQI